MSENVKENKVSRGTLASPENLPISKKRKNNANLYKRRLTKKRKNLGHAYISISGKEVKAAELGPSCKCNRKCGETIGQTEAEHIFNSFWNIGNYNEQNAFLFGSIKVFPKKRSYKKKTKSNTSRRTHSVQYYVKSRGQDIRVCKVKFISIYGLKSQMRLQLIIDKIKSGNSSPTADNRGKHSNRPNKISTERRQSVFDHIKEIPKYQSHYSRAMNPNKLYFDSDMNIEILYRDYYVPWCIEKNIEPVINQYYRLIFNNEFNIGFKLPKSDTCKSCDLYKVQTKSLIDDDRKRKLERDQELHLHSAKSMQTNLVETSLAAKSSSSKTHVLAFDLQQALPTPSLTVGPAFYLRKLWTYNFGIHDCGTDKGYMYVWTEDTAKRGSEEIGSIVLKHINENTTEAEHLILFTDNCGGQNKNWNMMALWRQLIIDNKYKSVEHRFLLPGHTHLPCDRDFAFVEKRKRFVKEVYCPTQWVEVIKKSKIKNPFIVTKLITDDFKVLSTLKKNINHHKNVTDDFENFKFKDIRIFRFEKENPNIMLIKRTIDGYFEKVNIGRRGAG